MGRHLLILLTTTLGTAADFNPAQVIQQPRSRWTYAGTSLFLTVTRGGEADRTQWMHNGNPLPGATNDILPLPYIQPPQAGQYVAVVSGQYSSATSEVAHVRVYPTNPLEPIWSHPLIITNLTHSADSLVTDEENSIYTAGRTSPFPGTPFTWTTKYDQHGSILWNSTSVVDATQLRLRPGHAVTAYDSTYNGGFSRIDYDSNGTITATFQRSGTNLIESGPVGVDAMENVYVGSAPIIIKYRSDGEQVWNIRTDDFFDEITADNEGNVYAASATPSVTIRSGYVAKYGFAGNLLWKSSFTVATHILSKMTFDSAGNLYVVARTQCFSCADSLVYAKIMKFSPAGQLIWATRCYDNPWIYAIIADDQNGLYVAGGSQFGVIASVTRFSPDGVQLWTSGVPDDGGGRTGQLVGAINTLGDGSVVFAGHWLRRLRPVLAGLPVIVGNPRDQTIEPGAAAVLSVTVSNPASDSLQWLRGGFPVSGATNSTFTASSSGAYSVVVMNNAGFVISRTADVTFALRLNVKRDAGFIRISATGEPNVSYWLAVSGNLGTNYWSWIQSQSSPIGIIEWLISPTDAPHRFFKAARFD